MEYVFNRYTHIIYIQYGEEIDRMSHTLHERTGNSEFKFLEVLSSSFMRQIVSTLLLAVDQSDTDDFHEVGDFREILNGVIFLIQNMQMKH